jgi:hypothetical protein
MAEKKQRDANQIWEPPVSWVENCRKREGYRISFVGRPDIDIIFVIEVRRMHQSGHLALVFVQFFVVIVHGGLRLFSHRADVSIQVFAEPGHALATEDAEDVSLLLCELWWGFPAECSKVVLKESLDASQTQVREPRAVVDQWSNALGNQISIDSC